MSQWRSRARKRMLEWLRPGQSEAELLGIVQRAEFIRSDEQRRMLVQAVEFHDTRVREIMTPRSDLSTVDLSISADALEKKIMSATVTRLPVTDGDLDNIVGVVYLWDLFSALIKQQPIVLSELLRPCPKISELQRVAGLLSEMREASHVAIVQDEFGGTAGLVTLSDLLEEIVGEIDEDTNEEEAGITSTASGVFEVLARVHIEELADVLACDLPKGDFDTVAGMITSELGRIPVAQEQFTIAGLEIKVIEADPRRIIRVRVQHAQAH